MVYLDCDEFWSGNCEVLFRAAEKSMVSVKTVHWRKDGKLYEFGRTEIHKRLWPASMDVDFPINKWWVESSHYNGNPNRHVVRYLDKYRATDVVVDWWEFLTGLF